MTDGEQREPTREEAVKRMKEQYEQDVREGRNKVDWRLEPPKDWLIESIYRIIAVVLISILIMIGIWFWVYKDITAINWKLCLQIGGIVGGILAILTALLYIDQTPLNKYDWIRDICSFAREILSKGG